ncbi:hypothetical protein O181_028788 [Austropuccinia psidii MF-1]|uniref:Retroviral polymerase SH3-like domain-containing protein n=1 Tax=Austropuccinia psidii MF-1 TaxID=1389203 RepID=A0A9Q3CUJ7_9BASI|nr:hypothetical protein [Austropuccinia psidii MF-1]
MALQKETTAPLWNRLVAYPDSSLPNHYWAEASYTSTPLCNIIATPSRHNLSPHVLYRGSPPQIKHLKMFGCCAIITIPKHHRKWKLSLVAEEGLFLGYENDNTADCILQTRDRKVIMTKHVTFHELTFPLLDHPEEPIQPLLVPSFSPKDFITEEETNTSYSAMRGENHSNQSVEHLLAPNEQVNVVDEFHQPVNEE